MKIVLISILLSYIVFAKFEVHTTPIGGTLKKRMIQGNSWKKSCPVHLQNLRYMRLSYIDFDGETKMGELIVHKEVSENVARVFEGLYDMKYPIDKMQLISDYKGNDWASIEAGNTSAFNCRKATGSKKWSKHSYGKAIDINPRENPYISRSGRISHKASLKYRKRAHKENSPADRAILLKSDKSTKIFQNNGWKWGGDWKTVKDYQHFSHD